MVARYCFTWKHGFAIHPGSRQPFYSQLHPPPPPFQVKCQVGALLLGKLMIKTQGKNYLEVFFWQIPMVWREVLHSENDHVYS